MSRAEIDKSAKEISVEGLVEDINEEASDYEVGKLLQIRKELKDDDKTRTYPKIFHPNAIKGDYAYHRGWRTEPQFNIAYRKYDGELKLRYGLGISLQDSRWTSKPPDPKADDMREAMRPRIELFNEYLAANPEEFADLTLWYESKGSNIPEGEQPASPIPKSFVVEENFINLGKREKPSSLSYDDILTLFDRLLPLYKYIERNLSPEDFSEQEDSTQAPDEEHLSTSDTHKTTAERTAAVVSVELTHDWMRDVLAKRLASEHGTENVHVERSTQHGKSIDLVVQVEDGEWFYEVKPFSEPRLCFRKAIGQLLEYAYWSDSEAPERLIVVGKSELGSRGEAYLSTLRERFSLPLEYQSVQIG